MLDKLEAIKARWQDVGDRIIDPAAMADMKSYAKLTKEYKDLKIIVDAYDRLTEVISQVADNKELIKTEKDDHEFVAMAKAELSLLEEEEVQLREDLKQMLIPKDPEDEKNVIVEIRAGTGGDEAGIFVGDLLRMYTKYCESRKWKTELLTVNESSSGGYKEVGFSVTGEGVYGELKFESGVHRVQRVPVTESQGRVHTSAASVAVLPEADMVDVNIRTEDIRVDTFRASGAGGQHVNKTESAVRLTHIPTGVVVECQEGRSQLKNREIAMKVLSTRIYEAEHKKHIDAIAAKRKTMVSTGDRSAKIRTYNWPQGRVTDHRINLTLYHLDAIIGGDLQNIIDALRVAENAEKLKAGED